MPPHWWRSEEVAGRPCSRDAVLKALEEAEPHDLYDGERLLAELTPASELARVAAGHPEKLEVFLWQGKTAVEPWAVRPSPLTIPDFKTLESEVATVEGGILRVLRPLELKQRVATPALTLHPETKRHCVYIGRVKDQASSAEPGPWLCPQTSVSWSNGCWTQRSPLAQSLPLELSWSIMRCFCVVLPEESALLCACFLCPLQAL